MRFVVLLLAASMLVPAAHAVGLPGGCFFTVASACYSETREGAPCGPGETGSSSTNVMVLSPAGLLVAGGSSWCNAFDAYESVGVGFFSGSNVVFVAWDESGTGGCHTTATLLVASAYQRQDAGCPAGGPPNPGWGALLP